MNTCILIYISLRFRLIQRFLQTDFFFIFLLPPIIFDAGFNLDVGPYVLATVLSTQLTAQQFF